MFKLNDILSVFLSALLRQKLCFVNYSDCFCHSHSESGGKHINLWFDRNIATINCLIIVLIILLLRGKWGIVF